MFDYYSFLTLTQLRNQGVVLERTHTSSGYRLCCIIDRLFGIVVPSVGQVNYDTAGLCAWRYSESI